MDIGIKFCGGCNSTYDRGRQVAKLKSAFPEHHYVNANEQTTCDLWLIVCGCLRSCADISGLKAIRQCFIIGGEYEFNQVRHYLTALRKESAGSAAAQPIDNMTAQPSIHPRELSIGMRASISKCFTREDVLLFASLTGDTQRIHTDVNNGLQSMYGKPIVHGVFITSLMSTVMGMQLPGEGTILVEQQIRHLKPAFYNDTVTAEVTLMACIETKDAYLGTFSGICKNQNGDILAIARYRQLMMKTLFYISNPKEKLTIPETDLF